MNIFFKFDKKEYIFNKKNFNNLRLLKNKDDIYVKYYDLYKNKHYIKGKIFLVRKCAHLNDFFITIFSKKIGCYFSFFGKNPSILFVLKKK